MRTLLLGRFSDRLPGQRKGQWRPRVSECLCVLKFGPARNRSAFSARPSPGQRSMICQIRHQNQSGRRTSGLAKKAARKHGEKFQLGWHGQVLEQISIRYETDSWPRPERSAAVRSASSERKKLMVPGPTDIENTQPVGAFSIQATTPSRDGTQLS